jgi:hypothetical protein
VREKESTILVGQITLLIVEEILKTYVNTAKERDQLQDVSEKSTDPG